VKAILDKNPSLHFSELIMDLDRRPTIRFTDGSEIEINIKADRMCIDRCVEFLGSQQNISKNSSTNRIFSSDNRVGISQTLHRISAIPDRHGNIVGLTYRVGRHIAGVAALIKDILFHLGSKSLLLLGPPGVGKTSLLRDVTRTLSDQIKKRVIIVDTSNEIAGEGSVPHDCIGKARRMQVRDRNHQDETLMEAVQNHNPEVIIIDELGNAKEVAAASSISQRGVSMVATAHGVTLQSLLKNPPMIKLLGGIQAVTLGDSAAKERAKNFVGEGKKTVLERAGAPIFDVVIELKSYQEWRVYRDSGNVVDMLLRGENPIVEVRNMKEDGRMYSRFDKVRDINFDEKWFQLEDR